MDIFKTCLQGIFNLSIIVIIASCGGGGDSGTAGLDGTGGPPKTQAAKSFFIGPLVNTDGTISVNGVTFQSDNASITINGNAVAIGDTSYLKTGQVVVVSGTLNNDIQNSGTATAINFTANVRGPIDNFGINLRNNTLKVLGQTVILTNDTRPFERRNSLNSVTSSLCLPEAGWARFGWFATNTGVSFATDKSETQMLRSSIDEISALVLSALALR